MNFFLTPPHIKYCKSVFYISFLFVVAGLDVMAQPCQQADTTITPVPTPTPVPGPVRSVEQWVAVTTDSNTVRIIINSHSDTSSGHVYRAVLYKGPCSSLVQLTNDYQTSEEDSILQLYARELTPGETYYLKLEFDFDTTGICRRCGTGTGSYDISIENLSRDFIIPNGVCIEACSNNLAVNGGFEQGNTGFVAAGTFYPCNQQNIPAFHHGICNNANDLHLNWLSPPRSGNLALFVDDPENDNDGPVIQPEHYIWSRNVGVVPNTYYCFRGWFRNAVSPNCSGCSILPDVYIGIDGNITLNQQYLVSTGPLPVQGPWTLLEYYWYSGPNTFATFYFYSTPNGTGSAGNDIGIDDVKIHGEASVPLISVSPTTIICKGQQVTLTAITYSENPTYEWSTGATTQSIQVSPTTTTIYSVTVDDGCDKTTNQVIIRVIPTFSLIVSPSPACMGSAIQFTNDTYTGGYSTTWSWNFGDPASGANNTSTLQSPSHLFSEPGTYQVTLTANNSLCGIHTHTQTIHITPSTPTYNPNCCSANQSIYTDNSITIGTIPSNVTTWNNLSKVIQYDLVVTPGATLNILNSTIQFGPVGRLIVQPQGKVVVDNSALRGLLSCGTMWMGAEVWGNSSKNQYQTDVNGNIYHGKFIIRNNSFIRDAHNGAIPGKTSGSFYSLTENGGIMEASNSSFINCGISIKPVYYNFPSASEIRNCNFTCSTLLDPGYGLSGPYQYPVNNPGFGLANAMQRTWAHVSSANARRTKFMDNLFSNSEYGVYSVNSAHWYIDGDQDGFGNFFSGMTRAMRMDYYWSTIFGNRIENNYFDNISAPIWLLINGARGDIIRNNRFNRLNISPQQNSFVAMGIAGSSVFKILDNIFDKMGMGVWIYYSGALGGLIGYESFGNLFDFCKIGERVSGNNQALQIRCNNHANNNTAQTPYYLDWEVLNLNLNSSLANQGNFPALSDEDPAGNEFNSLNSNLYNEIWSDYAVFNYLHHNPANNLSVVPGISPLSGQTLSTSNLIATPFLKNGGASCAPVNCPPPCPQRTTLSHTLQSLGAEYNATLANIDGGNTAEVLNTISAGLPPGQMNNYLQSRFPLSDEALIAFINLQGTPPGIFKDVILANSPVSDHVRPVLYSLLAGLPSGIAGQIRDNQYSTANRTLTAISRESESVRQQILFIDTDAMLWYADQDDVNNAVSSIGAQGNFDADEVITATWIQQGDYSAAASVLGSMVAVTGEQQDYIALQNMLLNLSQSGRSVFEMTAAEEQLVRTIAGRAASSLARTNARAILFYVFNEEFNDELDLNPSLRLAPGETLSQDFPGASLLGSPFPNPSGESVSIPYYLDDQDGGLMIIKDAAGKVLKEIGIKCGTGKITLQKGALPPGVYFVHIDVGGIRGPSRKLIIY